ncbi:hypothetical protein LF41_144 [Lysobacter dokdonensis DS-58]|uniref:Uncharacterized protein n=1 Tax=Lysobacter dokdonensis DS-58 TaxID=1300345 RepID=A0A0A2WK05_9GAMM|nr:hypothetical protein [Lysobacter dokdonensis]KGQ19052.1 hypothetical protein LF41_144 [Lysobacter dokdonensis DS-58]
MRAHLPLCLALALLPLAAMAEEPAKATPDPALKAQLERLGMKYEVSGDGDYSVVFKYTDDGDRTQLVFVRSAVETYGSHKIREVWAPAYKSPNGTIPETVANRLLEASDDLKLGAWSKSDGYALFVVKIPADAGDDALDDALQLAGVTADDMENELTPGKDEF